MAVEVLDQILPEGKVNWSEYAKWAEGKLFSHLTHTEALKMVTLGRISETGEFLDVIKKLEFHNPINLSELLDAAVLELGDITFYTVLENWLRGVTYKPFERTDFVDLATLLSSAQLGHIALEDCFCYFDSQYGCTWAQIIEQNIRKLEERYVKV